MVNTRANLDVRGFLAINGIMHKTIAEALGLTRSELSNMMRYELSEVEKKRLFSAAEEIIRGRGDEPKRIQVI